MRIDRFDYELPKELIAQQPAAERDAARLLVLDRRTQRWQHENFPALLKYLKPGDCLVVNDTKVMPARLTGARVATGGRWEGLFLERGERGWEMLCKTRGAVAPGERIRVDGTKIELELVERTAAGPWMVRPVDSSVEPEALMEAAGKTPLPPYIRDGKESPFDRERYQTVYAEHPGSVAAPTAGLHFTPKVLSELAEAKIDVARVTLHVGIGTFLPIKAENVEEHAMHAERCEVSEATAEKLKATRAAGGRIVAVGTTAVRALETAARGGELAPYSGSTDIFITPGHEFRAVDALLTNFHLPRSTLLLLAAAFAGEDAVLAAYREAVKRKYRFFSYGDAMLIV
ncbi:MAG TPA: tRNA preQ1(34) S-adenosylmethionine ribosyltransferase-isomerase QueA [Planctomycetia bacterium]|nr:tRNA preQ1(34) S-adenosylmethionine ribosyltransferase-isomerase QueA [Planctomycetia bacterium]